MSIFFSGQMSVPSGIRVQCFMSSDCAAGTEDGSEMTTEANFNPCCIKRSSNDPNTFAVNYNIIFLIMIQMTYYVTIQMKYLFDLMMENVDHVTVSFYI